MDGTAIKLHSSVSSIAQGVTTELRYWLYAKLSAVVSTRFPASPLCPDRLYHIAEMKKGLVPGFPLGATS